MLLAATACSGSGDTSSTPRSTQPPMPTGTGATVATYDRGRFAAVIPLPGAGSMTVADGVLWVLDATGMVVRLDPQTNAVVGKPFRAPADAVAIAVHQGALWVTSVAPGDLGVAGKDAVTRIDLASGYTVATIRVRRAPLDVAATPGAVWVTNSGGGGDSVARIDPTTNRVVGSPIPIGFRAGNLAVAVGGVWVTSDYRVDAAPQDVVVVRIDPQTNRAVETIAVGGHPIDVAATESAIWVSVANPGTLLRIAGR
jgi:DNA-binding beta-propeller fold protein YncE